MLHSNNRLFDVCNIQHYDIKRSDNNAEWAKEIVYRTPTEDVVPVVRCKDCKHYARPSLDEDNYYCLAEHTDRLFSPNKTDYCSYGERKNDNGKL